MYVLYDEMATSIHVPFCFIIFLSYHIYTQTLTISKITFFLSFALDQKRWNQYLLFSS